MINIQNYFRENIAIVLLTLLVLIFLLFAIIRRIVLLIEEHKKDREIFDEDLFKPVNEKELQESLKEKRDSAYKIIERKK